MGEQLLPLVREICMAFPEVEERLSHGAPTWFVRGKRSFAMFVREHHGARFGMWCAAPAGIATVLVAEEPERYFIPPYVGTRGWVGAFLDVPNDADNLRDMLEEAYRAVAPPVLQRQMASQNG